jgi:hypothetical protein
MPFFTFASKLQDHISRTGTIRFTKKKASAFHEKESGRRRESREGIENRESGRRRESWEGIGNRESGTEKKKRVSTRNRESGIRNRESESGIGNRDGCVGAVKITWILFS